MSDPIDIVQARAASMAAHPAGSATRGGTLGDSIADRKELFPRRVRVRSRFIVRYDAIITVIVASAVSFCLGMALQFHLDHLPIPGVTQ